MAADFDNRIGGPADAQYAAATIGHTSGGIKITVTPEHHMVTVDQFGSSACNVRHNGETVRFTVPFAELVAGQLALLLASGDNQTAATASAHMGIGRTPGLIYTSAAFKAIPFLTADAAKLVEFFRVVPIGEINLNYQPEDEMVFEVEHAALVDESKSDGAYIGKIFLTGA